VDVPLVIRQRLMTTGSGWSLGSVAAAIRICGSSCSSSTIRTSSTSAENRVSFLDPLIESWDIDLATFGLEIVLNHRVAPGQAKRFEFVEREAEQPVSEEPGLQEFLQDPSLGTRSIFAPRRPEQGRGT